MRIQTQVYIVKYLPLKAVLQVDRKVEELRAVVQGKEAEISELRARLNRAVLTANNRPDTEADRDTMAHTLYRKFSFIITSFKYLLVGGLVWLSF